MLTRLTKITLGLILMLALAALPAMAGNSSSPPGDTSGSKSRATGSTAEKSSRASATTSTQTTSPSSTAPAESYTRPRNTNPQLNTYVPRVNRLEPVSDTRERFPQPEDDRAIVWVQSSNETEPITATSGPASREDLEKLLERDEVLVERKTYGGDPSDDLIVFCARDLHEYHLDRNCPMLEDTTPTPRRLKVAKSARYTECSVCKKRHQR